MHPDVYKRPLLLALAVFIIALCFFYHPVPSRRDVFHFIGPQEVTLTGQVESFSIIKKETSNVWIRVQRVNGRRASGRVYARIRDFDPQWKDTLQISGRLRLPYSISLPGNFDWRAYLAQKHTFAEIKSSQVKLLYPATRPWRMIRAVRRDILRVLNEHFPAPLSSIASGILLGERGELKDDLYTAFQDSGAVHLLVASGGNVGFVTLLTLAMGSWLGLRRRKLLLAALVTAGIYTLIAGADAPLLRAYLMAASACIGYFLGRNSGVFQGLLISCLIILLIDPATVFDTGFQMSFLATLSIVICLNNYRVPSAWPKAVRFLVQIFLATLASQLVLLPIFTNVFYKVSLTGLISNMLLVPLASVLMAFGFAFYVLTLLHAEILLYYPFLWGLDFFRIAVEFFASFRFSSWPMVAWNGGSITAYYILLFWISQFPNRLFFRKLAAPCLVLAGLAWIMGYGYTSLPRAYILSEWNTRAVLVRLDKHTHVLFNAGLDKEKLERALRALGVRRVEGAFSFDKTTSVADLPALLHKDAFVDIWPGETVAIGSSTVKAVWGIHETKDGRLWEDVGYSGMRGGNISYCVKKSSRTVCVGNAGRFIQLPSKELIRSKRNETVQTRW